MSEDLNLGKSSRALWHSALDCLLITISPDPMFPIVTKRSISMGSLGTLPMDTKVFYHEMSPVEQAGFVTRIFKTKVLPELINVELCDGSLYEIHYELNKSGNIHLHIVIQAEPYKMYEVNYVTVQKKVKKFLTAQRFTDAYKVCLDLKQTTDSKGLDDYLNVATAKKNVNALPVYYSEGLIKHLETEYGQKEVNVSHDKPLTIVYD